MARLFCSISVPLIRLSELVDYALDAFIKLIRYIKCCKLIYAKTTLRFAEIGLIVELALQDLLTVIQLEPFYALAVFP